MFVDNIFIFGAKIFCDIEKDALSSLPLELSWKIFSYLDDMSLRTACRVYKVWRRIIMSCKKLRNRLNKFELAVTLGSERLAKYYRKSIRTRRKKNFKPMCEAIEQPTQSTAKSYKRKGDGLVIHTKRFKLS